MSVQCKEYKTGPWTYILILLRVQSVEALLKQGTAVFLKIMILRSVKSCLKLGGSNSQGALRSLQTVCVVRQQEAIKA